MKIHYLNGEFAGRKVEIPSSGAAIGRETDNDIQLLVGGVSRYHAKLECRDGVWTLRDLGSTNGTKHNGDLITQPVKLSDGDVFSVGDQIFRVEGIGTSVPPPEPAPSCPAAGTDSEPAFVFRMPSPGDAPEETSPDKTSKITDSKQNGPSSGTSSVPFGDLFGKDGKTESSASAGTQDSDAVRKRRTRSNVLFYILVAMVAVLCVVLFWRFQTPVSPDAQTGKGGVRTQVRGNPFFLFYEKQAVTKNNAVFQFKLLLENDHLSFSLDDLQSGRVYAPVISDPIRPEAIEKLKKTILDTNFMSSAQQEKMEDAADGIRNFSRIAVGFDDKFNDITVRDIVLTSFTRVEEAIGLFLYEEFGLDSSMVESRETLIRQARAAFDLAEKQYNSSNTQPGNLWRAIENYRIAMRRYEVFAEKPPEWALSREQLTKAEARLEEIRKTGHHMVNMYYQQREYNKALEECARLMEYFPPDSEAYGKIREFKIQIEKIMKGNK